MKNSAKNDDIIFNYFKQICDEKNDEKCIELGNSWIEAMEKNLVTADYLNNLSYEAPGGAQQEMFRTGGNNMMSVGDIITTQDGTKYESYPDTVVNEFDRPVTTIRFRPITEE